MRPTSVIQFERLYLVSLLVVVLQQVAGYIIARQIFAQIPGGADIAPGMGGFLSGALIIWVLIGMAFSVGIPLLLWWLAARNRTEAAKWLLMVISVLSVLMWLFSLAMLLMMPTVSAGPMEGMATMQAGIIAADGLGELLGIAALWYLFRPDATAWFRTAGPNVSAEVFR